MKLGRGKDICIKTPIFLIIYNYKVIILLLIILVCLLHSMVFDK